jgi:hypothetical protein
VYLKLFVALILLEEQYDELFNSTSPVSMGISISEPINNSNNNQEIVSIPSEFHNTKE